MAGHSIGEYVAATIAGVFDLPTAVKVVSMRARLMHAAPRGVMVAVAMSPDAIAEYLSPTSTSPRSTIPAAASSPGSDENIRKFSERLAEAGIAARRVRTSHAFHSRLMDPVLPEFNGFLSRLTLREPQIPLLSNITGTWMSDDRGDQSRDVGAPNTGNGPVRRRTRRAARRSEPRPGRGRSRRHPDRVGDASPAVVEAGTAPFG